jgi:chitinase
MTCQKKGKTIILSTGGATYSEGGFQSEAAAKAGADLIWKTFGPATTPGPSSSTPHITPPALINGSFSIAPYSNATSRYRVGRFNHFRPFHHSNSTGMNSTGSHGVRAKSPAIHRPFGNATVDGFDFDFEAKVAHIAPFANRLRKLSDADKSRKYYLTAAPQCPYPDVADKDILHGLVSIDAVFVQFYNNWCGVNSFTKGQQTQNSFNFQEWDNWAKTVSKNDKVKVLLGVPANTKAASSGYIPASALEQVIRYSKSFSSFGGVMMWDVTQAYGNEGFLDGVKNALKKSSSRLLRHGYRIPSILR